MITDAWAMMDGPDDFKGGIPNSLRSHPDHPHRVFTNPISTYAKYEMILSWLAENVPSEDVKRANNLVFVGPFEHEFRSVYLFRDENVAFEFKMRFF